MPIPFDSRLRVPDDVMISELEGESVLLNLKTEVYFGLDDVGTRVWTELAGGRTLQEAFDVLAGEYDVEPDRLRGDLSALVDKLVDHGLLEAFPQANAR